MTTYKELNISIDYDKKKPDVKILTNNNSFELNFNLTKDEYNQHSVIYNFIKNVKKLIKSSNEYSYYTNVLKTEKKLDKCSIYSNLNVSLSDLEIYYGPLFSLEDIIELVVAKRNISKKPNNSIDVASEILDLHFKGMIQFVMLSKLAISMIEKNYYNIPFIDMRLTNGDIIAFLKRFRRFLTATHLNSILKYLKLYKLNKKKETNHLNDYLEDFMKQEKWKV